LYKIFFATNFVRNTYEFYNFVENNYPKKLLFKILRKNNNKKFFLINFFNKFIKKFSYNMKNFSSDSLTRDFKKNIEF